MLGAKMGPQTGAAPICLGSCENARDLQSDLLAWSGSISQFKRNRRKMTKCTNQMVANENRNASEREGDKI